MTAIGSSASANGSPKRAKESSGRAHTAPCAWASAHRGRDRDQTTQSRTQQHQEGLALARTPGQGDQPGGGEGNDHDGPDDLGGQVPVRVHQRCRHPAGHGHRRQQQRADGQEGPRPGRTGGALFPGGGPGALPDLAELADDDRGTHGALIPW